MEITDNGMMPAKRKSRSAYLPPGNRHPVNAPPLPVRRYSHHGHRGNLILERTHRLVSNDHCRTQWIEPRDDLPHTIAQQIHDPFDSDAQATVE